MLRRTRARLSQLERRSEGLSTFVTDRRKTPVRSLTPIATPKYPHPPPAAVPVAPVGDPIHAKLLTAYLAELCDRLGADETVLWRSQPDGTVAAAAWSGGTVSASRGIDLDGARPDSVPPSFRHDRWMPLVQWAGTQHLVQCERLDADAPPPASDPIAAPGVQGAGVAKALPFVVAPIADEARGYFALSASAALPGGLRGSEDEIRASLSRSAMYVSELADLIHAQAQSERQVRHANVLVNSAKMFQSKRSVENLAQAVCRDALQITGGTRSALVKWDGGAQSGFVQSVSPNHWVEEGHQVIGQSRVGELCAEDQSQVWEDARHLDRSTPIYNPGDSGAGAPLGSLLIVPMKQEQRVVGAIVVEGTAAGDVLMADLGPVRTLAAIASASLDHLWRMEIVKQASITDKLTGLSNRRHFDEQLLRLLSAADQQRQPISLIVLDIDHFKRVNDSYGHEAGDAVLQAVANIVTHAIRAGALCARYGGEEIAILLPGVPSMEALEIAERLRRSVASKPVAYGGQKMPITASFGVASYPETARTHGTLFPAADRALYEAKAGGRNRVSSAGVSDGAAAISKRPAHARRAAG